MAVFHARCEHKAGSSQCGLALITVGNPLRCDDGIAELLCDTLPPSCLKNVCRYDIASSAWRLGECLAGHKAAIIVDATCNGTTYGTISLVDLNMALFRNSRLEVNSCYGFSLLDELRLVKQSMELPKRLMLFGVEVANTSFGRGISPNLKKEVPELAGRLSGLIQRILETMSKAESA
jgi:hydrogenase maturation protease